MMNSSDPSTLLESTLSSIGNLQKETQFILSEIQKNDKDLQNLKKFIDVQDTIIQKHIIKNGAIQENPKEPEIKRKILQSLESCKKIQERKNSLANTLLYITTVKYKDLVKGMDVLEAEGILAPSEIQEVEPQDPVVEILMEKYQSLLEYNEDSDNNGEYDNNNNNNNNSDDNEYQEYEEAVDGKKRKIGSSGSTATTTTTTKSTKSSAAAATTNTNSSRLNTPGLKKTKTSSSMGGALVAASSSSSSSTSKKHKLNSSNEFNEMLSSTNASSGSATSKNAKADEEEDEEDDDKQLYCFCQNVSYGEMVACDGKDCKYDWFHYSCVNLTEPPKGKWYCPDCKAK